MGIFCGAFCRGPCSGPAAPRRWPSADGVSWPIGLLACLESLAVESRQTRSSFESVLKNKNLAHLDRVPREGDTAPLRRVACVLRENFSMMAFTGAEDALITANLMSAAPLYEVLVVGGADEVAVSDLGIAISAGYRLAELKEKELQLLVTCGGFRVRLQADPLLRAKLRSADAAGASLGGLRLALLPLLRRVLRRGPGALSRRSASGERALGWSPPRGRAGMQMSEIDIQAVLLCITVRQLRPLRRVPCSTTAHA